jgi:hypothetical protein
MSKSTNPKTTPSLAEKIVAALQKREASAWSGHEVTIIFRHVDDADHLSQLLAFADGKGTYDVFARSN